MCREVNCTTCGKMTWTGCGSHIEQALGKYSIIDRCKGWQTRTCPMQPGHKEIPEIAKILDKI